MMSVQVETPEGLMCCQTRWVPVLCTLAILVGTFTLLFARLGFYPLWTDEASTAITAAGVYRTGDTSAWLDDHNLLAYRDGLLLKGQKDRYTSPLQFYLAAPFVGLLGHSSLAARLPFAICGLLTIILLLRWLWHWRPADAVWIAAAVVVLTCTSFYLFQRQCRYYAPTTFFLTLTVYLYCRWDGNPRQLLCIGFVMSLLLASQYLDYAATVGCMVVDYGIWGRKRRAIRGRQWLFLILPQLVTAACICPVWNPIARAASVVHPTIAPLIAQHIGVASTVAVDSWFSDFCTVLWWNLRDLVACDFVILPLLMICPLLYFARHSPWLLRGPLAFCVFVAGIAVFTTHPVAGAGNAEVRYLAPLLPLCIAIAIVSFAALQSVAWMPRTAVICLAALSMLIGPDTAKAATISCSTADYYLELANPPVASYLPVAAWISAHVPARATVCVMPDFCVSPLMWTAPEPTYIWQLDWPAKKDYLALPGWYFKGQGAPEYLITFGPYRAEAQAVMHHLKERGLIYEPVETVDVYWKEMFRPELIWRSSKPIPAGSGEHVYIYHLLPTK